MTRSRRIRVSLLPSPLHATRTALTRHASDASSAHPSSLSIASSAADIRRGCYSHVGLSSTTADRHIYLMIFDNCGTRSFAKTSTTHRAFVLYDRLVAALQRTQFIVCSRAFSVAVPILGNTLPQHLTLTSMTIAAFKIKLKT